MNVPTFYVSCHVKEPNLYALLMSLEAAKVGNVEVRPIPPPMLALPAPLPVVRGEKRQRAVAALAQGPKNAAEISVAAGSSHAAARQLLAQLVTIKVARRVKLGVYELRSK
jgi:hypothetical protein